MPTRLAYLPLQVLYGSVILLQECGKELSAAEEEGGDSRVCLQVHPQRREKLVGHHEQYGDYENNFGKPEEPSEQPIYE